MVEGIDGSGKSTLLHGLRAHYQSRYAPYSELVCLREPTDAAPGRAIRAHLRNEDQLTPGQWLELFFADREINVREHILPALCAGALIIQDRYFYSTAAYQGILPSDVINAAAMSNDTRGSIAIESNPDSTSHPSVETSTEATDDDCRAITPAQIVAQSRERFPEPDVLLFLDIAPEAAMQRIRNTRQNFESFETLEQLRRIDRAYRSILPPATVYLPANQSPEQVLATAVWAIEKSRRTLKS